MPVHEIDNGMRIRLANTKWCTNPLHHPAPAYCCIQLDGSHIAMASCRCPYPGERCPIDFHHALDVDAHLRESEGTW